jgi:NADH-quinone oxidoreductase subunit F
MEKGKRLKRINSTADLESIRDAILRQRDAFTKNIRICNTGCQARKSLKVSTALSQEIKARGLADTVAIKETGCHGFCELGPILVIEPENIFYCRVKAEDIPEIISETILGDRIIDRLLWQDTQSGAITCERDLPFYREQKKHVSGNCGKIDPTDIEDYIANNGYTALCKVLTTMSSKEVVDTVIASGLRGRGGGGFPAGIKWRLCASAPGDVKYIIANGDEGDPGAFMDRSLMEGDPHSIIEGMIIGAFAIGANQGFLYVREEYPMPSNRRKNMACSATISWGLISACRSK